MPGDPIAAHVRLVIFDADDTLRCTRVAGQPCPCAPDEWSLLPNVVETLSRVQWAKRSLRFGVASNQDWVGYGRLSAAMSLRLIHDMVFAATWGKVDQPLIRICPHVLEERCGCRKPQPGMLLDLMRTASVRSDQTLYIGNADVDEAAARRAAVPFVWAQEFFRP